MLNNNDFRQRIVCTTGVIVSLNGGVVSITGQGHSVSGNGSEKTTAGVSAQGVQLTVSGSWVEDNGHLHVLAYLWLCEQRILLIDDVTPFKEQSIQIIRSTLIENDWLFNRQRN